MTSGTRESFPACTKSPIVEPTEVAGMIVGKSELSKVVGRLICRRRFVALLDI